MGVCFFSIRSATSSTSKVPCFEVHIFRGCRDHKYSLLYRFRNIPMSFCMCTHRLAGCISNGWSIFVFIGGTCIGRYCISLPAHIKAGARVCRSKTSVEIGRNGREFNVEQCSSKFLVRQNIVQHSLLRWDFADLTPDSQSPSKWEAPGGIIVRVIPISSAAIGIYSFPNLLVRFIWVALVRF